MTNKVNDTKLSLDAENKSIMFSVKKCHRSTGDKAEELVKEFKSIGLNFDEKYLSFYLKLIELYDLYTDYFYEQDMGAKVKTQKGVISGLLSQTYVHVKDGNQQYTDSYYNLFLSIFAYPVVNAKTLIKHKTTYLMKHLYLIVTGLILISLIMLWIEKMILFMTNEEKELTTIIKE